MRCTCKGKLQWKLCGGHEVVLRSGIFGLVESEFNFGNGCYGLVWVFSGKIMAYSVFNQPFSRKGDFTASPQVHFSSPSSHVDNSEEVGVSSALFDLRVCSSGFLYKKLF